VREFWRDFSYLGSSGILAPSIPGHDDAVPVTGNPDVTFFDRVKNFVAVRESVGHAIDL
jgi:hypothetical protein